MQLPLRDGLLANHVRDATYFFLRLAPSGAGRVRVAFGGRERCAPDYRLQRESYPFPVLEYVVEGSGTFSAANAPRRPIGPGSIYGFTPGSPHQIETDPGSVLVKYFVSLSGRRAAATLARHVPCDGRVITLVRHEAVREIFDQMLREGDEHTPFSDRIFGGLLSLLFLRIAEAQQFHADPQGRARERFLHCKALIDERSTAFSSLGELAAALHTDPSGLNRLFRRFQGMTPYQYLLRRKMHLAARELIQSAALVKEVALRCGYEDPYHFSRVFKAVHGISPARFLRLHGLGRPR